MAKSEAESLIPPKGSPGRRTAAQVVAINWICRAAEACWAETTEMPPPVISTLQSTVPSVLDEVAPESQQPSQTQPAVVAKPVVPLSQPPVSAPSQSVVAPTSSNGQPEALDPVALDPVVEEWLKQEARKCLLLAGSVQHAGTSWAHRLAQVACGLNVLARGPRWARQYLPHLTTAAQQLIGIAGSTAELEQLHSLTDNLAYLDYLADTTGCPLPSPAIQGSYEDRYLELLG